MTNVDRRDFLKMTGVGLAVAFLPNMAWAESGNREPSTEKHKSIIYETIPPPELGYSPIVNEPHFDVILSDISTVQGRIERALRWSNITEAVGERCGVSSRTLLGMICVESGGDPIMPNDLNDGGVGLIHMQPYKASAYGLHMITPSKKMIDHSQGKKIRRAIALEDGNLKDLIKYDDRFHPIKNIDAAARMLCDHYENTHSWARAIERYNGQPSYDTSVMNYVKKMADSNFMNNLKTEFALRNKSAKVGVRNIFEANNGQQIYDAETRDYITKTGSPMFASNPTARPLTFDEYLAAFHQANRNYGLDEYAKLERYVVG